MRRFIAAHIQSAEQLAALALLREDPSRELSAAQLAALLRTNPDETERRLGALAIGGLISARICGAEVMYQFRQSDETRAEIELVLGYYGTHRVAVYEAIYARGNASIQALADAFVIRKKD